MGRTKKVTVWAGRRGGMLAQWAWLKRDVSEYITAEEHGEDPPRFLPDTFGLKPGEVRKLTITVDVERA